jgi:hypothetical protein
LIQLAFELPIELLDTRSNFDFDFVIASHCLKYPKYKEFYSKFRGERIMILDNGAFEDGKSIPFNQYLALITNLSPDIVVLPDVINNTVETMRETQLFCSKWDNNFRQMNRDEMKHITFMGVLQGTSVAGCLETLKFYIEEVENVNHIGIPYHLFYRPKFIKDYNIDEVCRKNNMKIHILGLPNPFELVELANIPEIVSLDTSLPIVSAIQELRFKVFKWNRIRLNMEADLNSYQRLIVAENIAFLKFLRDPKV